MAAAAGFNLAGCAPKKFATVEAFCQALPEQKYEIEGKTKFDQPWIDDTSVAVTAGCDRPLPQARPVDWDWPAAKAERPKVEPPKKKRTRFGVPLPKKKAGTSVWDNVPHPFRPK